MIARLVLFCCLGFPLCAQAIFHNCPDRTICYTCPSLAQLDFIPIDTNNSTGSQNNGFTIQGYIQGNASSLLTAQTTVLPQQDLSLTAVVNKNSVACVYGGDPNVPGSVIYSTNVLGNVCRAKSIINRQSDASEQTSSPNSAFVQQGLYWYSTLDTFTPLNTTSVCRGSFQDCIIECTES